MQRRPIGVMVAISLAATLMWFPSAGSAAVGSFSDDDGSVHEADIEAIAVEGITTGCNPPANDQFCPDEPVTRGQMAAFLVRALGLSVLGTFDFADDNSSVFELDIEKLAEAGITVGCNPPANERFCPDDPVTRGQMAAFIHRALPSLDASGQVSGFSDSSGSVFVADIDWLAATGVTKGCNPPANDAFCPGDSVTRGQMASFLSRALGLDPVPLYPIGTPDDEDLALVSRFSVYDDADTPNHMYMMAYWPRSFASGFDIDPSSGAESWQLEPVDDPGTYKGWDILSPPTHWGFDDEPRDDDWFRFNLTRPARVAVVWRDDSAVPGWLESGWTEGSGVTVGGRNARVYVRDFDSGQVELGTVQGSDGNYKTMYFVLLAEADGSPADTPPIPSGKTYPVPGESCPTWVHNQYRTTGPDGAAYGTWHPQWDPVYWCSFGHDHGSNPSIIPGAPLVPYEYLSVKNGKEESNAGFKEFIFKDFSGDYWVRFVVHAGTAGQGRACTQFHTAYTLVYDLDGNEIMNVGHMADFGRAVRADTDEAVSPTNCSPALPSLVDGRVRQLNVAGDDHHYEEWDAFGDTASTENIGFADFQLGLDMRNPMTECTSTTCNAVQQINRYAEGDFDNGSERAIEVGRWDGGLDISPTRAFEIGEFFTNPMATSTVGAGAENAVRQFVTTGAALVDLETQSGDYTVMCVPKDPWTMAYTCRSVGDGDVFPHVPDMQIQNGLRSN